MNQNDILQTITKNICEVMGETMAITPEMSLRELGANSIDRADILMQTMSDLKLKLSMIEFASAKNIGDIAAIFQRAL